MGAIPWRFKSSHPYLTSFAKKNKVETHFVYLLEVQQGDPFSTEQMSYLRYLLQNGSFYYAWIIQISAKIRLSQKHQAKPLFSGHYVKNGSVTDEVASVKIAIRHIQRKYAALPTQGRFELGWLADFGFLLKRICELD